MQLPDSVKVGPFLFDIMPRDEQWHRITDDWGSMVIDDLEINIVTTERPPVFIVDTLVHEIFHAIWDVFHLEEDDTEERIVATLATGWLGVLRDNPELVSCLLQVAPKAEDATE